MMKSFLIILFGCFGASWSQRNIGRVDSDCNNYVYRPIVDEDYEMHPDDIWYPCGLKQFNYNCIRRFLASKSECIPVFGKTPDPIRLPILQFHFPSDNLILTHTDVTISGFSNATVENFKNNKVTGNVVFTVHVPKLNVTSKKTYFTIMKIGKEPKVEADTLTYELYNAVFTVVIPKLPHLRLEWATVNFDMKSEPKYKFGPKPQQSKDPKVQQCLDFIKKHVMIMSRECYFFHSYYLMEMFIQSEICDFGVVPKNEVGFLRNMRFLGETYPHMMYRPIHYF